MSPEVLPPPVAPHDHIPRWLEGDLERAVLRLVRLEQSRFGWSAIRAGAAVLARLEREGKG